MMGEHEYIAKNKSTGNIDMFVSGEKKGKHFQITGLLGRKGSSLKAPDLYEHINQHHEYEACLKECENALIQKYYAQQKFVLKRIAYLT